MLHVRLVSPPAETGPLVAELAANPGVRSLVVLPGAARNPPGDAVLFDVHNESANPVLRRLRSLPSRGDAVVMVADGGVAYFQLRRTVQRWRAEPVRAAS